MKIAITGGTGLIGRGLTAFLLAKGHEVTVLSRDPSGAVRRSDPKARALRWAMDNRIELVRELGGVDIFVNLAGENIGSSLWTRSKRKRILESRLSAGILLTDIVTSLPRKPEVLVQASAVGIYGSRGEEILDETSSAGDGFLADVVRRWEDSTKDAETAGVRRIIIRTGVVLAPHGGAFPKLAIPYRLLFGMVLGSGKQWLPWIHYSDELEAIYFLMTQKSSSGVYNLVSPNPARMEEVCAAIGEALHRPGSLHIPGYLLRLGLGQMAEETILTSQRVKPSRLAEAGFGFKYAALKASIARIISEGDTE